jgi:hypothetical protein
MRASFALHLARNQVFRDTNERPSELWPKKSCRFFNLVVVAMPLLSARSSLLARCPSLRRLKRQFVPLAKSVIIVRIPIPMCIVVIVCALQPPHAKALTSKELVESCKSVEQRAQSMSDDEREQIGLARIFGHPPDST